VNHGMPQGSPLSPILSALFTSPLLKLTVLVTFPFAQHFC
jgi:hypothetical protein